MYENMNYAELEEWRDELLEEAAGSLERDEPKLMIIESISREMDRREAEAYRRVKSAVWVVNVLVLAVIVLTTSGCQTLKGGLGDAAWIIQKGADNINTEGK